MRLGSFRKPLRAVHFARHFRVTCSLHFGVVELHGGVLSNRQLLTGVHPRALQTGPLQTQIRPGRRHTN